MSSRQSSWSVASSKQGLYTFFVFIPFKPPHQSREMRAYRYPVSRIVFLLIILFLITTAFSASMAQARSWAGSGWSDFEDQDAGIQLKHPDDWQVRIDRKILRTHLRGPDGEEVVIWPVFIENTRAAARGLNREAATEILTKLLREIWPENQVSSLSEGGSNFVRVRDTRSLAALSWHNFLNGTAGYLYAVNAPTAQLHNASNTAAKIFESFKARGPVEGSAATTDPRLSWVRWHDPTEGAFSIEVPRDWTTKGGISRPAAVDLRVAWETTSPEGDIRITGGDASLPTFMVLNPTMQMGGYREGSWYTPGYGVQLMVRRYQTGLQFLTGYISERMAKTCSGPVEFTLKRNLPQLSQQVTTLFQQYGLPSSLNYGDVAFRCTQRNGGPVKGYYVAATQLNTAGGVQQWKVEVLLGYLAAVEKAPLAHQIYTKIVNSGQTNPDWHRRQGTFIEGITNIVSGTNAAIAKTIRTVGERQSRSLDALSIARSNTTLGLEDVVDTATGQQYKVESGSNFYWLNNRGQYIGTETYSLPDIDFRELTRPP